MCLIEAMQLAFLIKCLRNKKKDMFFVFAITLVRGLCITILFLAWP